MFENSVHSAKFVDINITILVLPVYLPHLPLREDVGSCLHPEKKQILSRGEASFFVWHFVSKAQLFIHHIITTGIKEFR